MTEKFNIYNKGISSVLILDDDWKVNTDLNELTSSAGVEQDYIDILDDEDDENTIKLIDLLNSKDIKSELLQDKINALFNPEIKDCIPPLFIEKIVNIASASNSERMIRLNIIKEALLDLGVPPKNIYKATNNSDAKEIIEAYSPDLFIFDLYLEVGNKELSLDLLKQLISDRSENKSQYILMSYDKISLTEFFRDLHSQCHTSSSKFKVIEKPDPSKLLEEKLRWQHALYLMSCERDFMHLLSNMQGAWAKSIDKASKELIKKVWELDSCSLNKLRITAESDHLSMAEYFPEIISKHIIGEFEESGSPRSEIILLEEALKSVNDSFTFSSSVEVVDSYETLKNLLADISSHRIRETLLFNEASNEETETLSQESYQQFKQELSFGTILRNKHNDIIFVHLTQPCDYIHVPLSGSDDESFLFFPGVEMPLYDDEKISNKTFITSYTRLSNNVVASIKWNLRRPITFSMKEFFEKRADFEIIGKLRDDYAQAICSKFASGVSRTALIKVPRFEAIKCNHLFWDEQSMFLTTDGEKHKITKDDINLETGKLFDARRFKDQIAQSNNEKKYHRFTLLGNSAAALVNVLQGTIKENQQISLELLDGVNLGDETSNCIEQYGIHFLHEKALFNQFDNIIKKAGKDERQKKTFNLILIRGD
ncbi:hypothetical protein WNY63_02085 [Pseudoalteromonas neustonica]|uniref:Response receiver domain-containing protein n=1 Tax=Pseudoalteromonas neustonica TaxID=1840331 RepID=A0ABU9TXL2_9GAMM